MKQALTRTQLFFYALVGVPFAFTGLPVYVNAPKFYAEDLGLSLGAIGIVLLIARIIDGVQDPIIGYWSDHFCRTRYTRYGLILFSVPLVTLSFIGLFTPPDISPMWLGFWLGGMLILLSTFFSIAQINYYALGAELTTSYQERNRISGWREAFIMLGILISAALPQFLVNDFGARKGYLYFALGIGVLIALVPIYAARFIPKPKLEPAPEAKKTWMQSARTVLGNKMFRTFLALLLINGTANAIPGTLVLFFTRDVLGAQEQSGYLLAIYFLSGVLGMPLWLWLSKRTSKKKAFLISMWFSVATFLWAYLLQHGDLIPFYVICMLSGLCVGADMALTPSILADIAEGKGGKSDTASYFGFWNLGSKLCLALAAGIVLPLLSMVGYKPGVENTPEALVYLSAGYALIPCMLKMIAIYVLWRSTLGEEE